MEHSELGYKELLNESAKWGLGLGALMGLSRILEFNLITSASAANYILLTFEWVAAVAIYIYTILALNKSRAKRYDLTFRDIMNFSILVSIFAAVVVGASSHIYIEQFFGGYVNYIKESIDAIQSVIGDVVASRAANGIESDSATVIVDQLVGNPQELIKNVAENRPTIMSSIFTMISNYILSGAIFGAISAYIILKRDRKDEQK